MNVLKDMMQAMQSSKSVLNKLSSAELITPVISSAASDTDDYPHTTAAVTSALRSHYHDSEVCEDANDWLFHRSELANPFTINREDFLSHPSTRYQPQSQQFHSTFPSFGQSFSGSGGVAPVASSTSREGPTSSLRFNSSTSSGLGASNGFHRDELGSTVQSVAPSRVIKLSLETDNNRVLRVCLAQGPLIKVMLTCFVLNN